MKKANEEKRLVQWKGSRVKNRKTGKHIQTVGGMKQSPGKER